MNANGALQSQFLAALAMMRQVVNRCPDEAWDNETEQNRFWHIAYHGLFYTHLYLSPAADQMEPWPKARPNYNILGDRMPFPPYTPVDHSIPYRRADLVEYIDYCEAQVTGQLNSMDLTAKESGFAWIPLSKLELQLYNLRHLQSHVGELAERLWSGYNVSTDWLGIASD